MGIRTIMLSDPATNLTATLTDCERTIAPFAALPFGPAA
jgi:hypothetical protein